VGETGDGKPVRRNPPGMTWRRVEGTVAPLEGYDWSDMEFVEFPRTSAVHPPFHTTTPEWTGEDDEGS